MTKLHWGIRVQQALMAAVLIGPTTKIRITYEQYYLLVFF
jgi:hypothetical protein